MCNCAAQSSAKQFISFKTPESFTFHVLPWFCSWERKDGKEVGSYLNSIQLESEHFAKSSSFKAVWRSISCQQDPKCRTSSFPRPLVPCCQKWIWFWQWWYYGGFFRCWCGIDVNTKLPCVYTWLPPTASQGWDMGPLRTIPSAWLFPLSAHR